MNGSVVVPACAGGVCVTTAEDVRAGEVVWWTTVSSERRSERRSEQRFGRCSKWGTAHWFCVTGNDAPGGGVVCGHVTGVHPSKRASRWPRRLQMVRHRAFHTCASQRRATSVVSMSGPAAMTM